MSPRPSLIPDVADFQQSQQPSPPELPDKDTESSSSLNEKNEPKTTANRASSCRVCLKSFKPDDFSKTCFECKYRVCEDCASYSKVDSAEDLVSCELFSSWSTAGQAGLEFSRHTFSNERTFSLPSTLSEIFNPRNEKFPQPSASPPPQGRHPLNTLGVVLSTTNLTPFTSYHLPVNSRTLGAAACVVGKCLRGSAFHRTPPTRILTCLSWKLYSVDTPMSS